MDSLLSIKGEKQYYQYRSVLVDWFPTISTIGSKGISQDLIGTAYYAYSVNLTPQAPAKVLGYDLDIKGLDSLYSSIRNAFEKHF